MQTPHGSRIDATPSCACSPSVPGETAYGTQLVATSQLKEGLTEQRHTVPMVLTHMMHYFAYEIYSRLKPNERFKRFPGQIQMKDVSALQSSTAVWALTGCGCSGCTNPRWRHETKQTCKGFLWLRDEGVMGTSICRHGADQANTLCSSLGKEKSEMHHKELEGKFIHSVGGRHNTKQPQTVSSSPSILAPSEPPLLRQEGGWSIWSPRVPPCNEAALCKLAVPGQGRVPLSSSSF